MTTVHAIARRAQRFYPRSMRIRQFLDDGPQLRRVCGVLAHGRLPE